jgi:hypothetical protein
VDGFIEVIEYSCGDDRRTIKAQHVVVWRAGYDDAAGILVPTASQGRITPGTGDCWCLSALLAATR